MQTDERTYNAPLYIVDDYLDLLLIFEAQQTRTRFTQNDDDAGLSCNLIGVCFNFKVFLLDIVPIFASVRLKDISFSSKNLFL